MLKNSYLKTISCILWFSLMLLALSCSTKKNTIVTRTFHNINSHFNGFYWATESVKEGVAKIERANVDDYSKILPVFIYTDPKDAKSVYAEMDKAITKCSLVIERHTITDKNGHVIPGAVKWIDDNYMLLGKAHFYKHDFFAGLEMFEYVEKEFKKELSRYDAMLWMMRSYNEIGSFSMTEPIIDFLNNDKNFPKDREAEFGAVAADYFIKLENYPQAIKYLSMASSLTRKRKVRARYTFILAQLYQKEKDGKKAVKYYEQVIKMSPSYEMSFNAIINRAMLHELSSSEGKKIKKDLDIMLKDFKNKEYKDQIYYALAEIAEKEKDIPLMVDYLKLSVRTSVANKNQKAISYLKLADVNFNIANYRLAQAYYDSTVSVIDVNFPNYEIIVNTKKSLSALVTCLNTISLEDSLQRLAAMSEGERGKLVDDLLADEALKEKKKKEELENQKNNQDSQQGQNTANINNNQQNNNQQQAGLWYFYDPIKVGLGFSDFAKKWGNRKLEDDWRRSSKESIQVQEEVVEVDTVEQNAVVAKPGDNKKKDSYLKNIPVTQGQIKKSNSKIVEAYYNLGSIYKEQLLNNDKSVESFETLLKRFPDNKYKLSLYYQLYLLHLALDNQDRADYYRNILLKDFPETEYAKIIKVPDYNKQRQTNKNEVERFYIDTYQKYKEAKYAEVISKCAKADSAFAKNALTPKFDYLRALAIGNSQDKKAFESALTQIIIKNPKNEVKDKAQELLDLLKKPKSESEPTAIAVDSSAKPLYNFNNEADYYWITVLENKKGDPDKFKIALSDMNKTYYGSAELNINSSFLDNDNQLIEVKNFKGKDKAMDYFNFIKGSIDVFKDLEANTYQHFIISTENYIVFYKEKKVQDYLGFFKEKILK